MPRAITALVVTVVATILVVNFHPSAIQGIAANRKATPKSSTAQTSSGGGTATASSSSSSSSTKTVSGDSVDTQYGPVQVQVSVKGGKIQEVKALALPFDNPQSEQISSVVEPMLRTEALRAQSAQIDVISGATYTSEGYASSLQSAIDKVRQA